jgi:hypothetical protein
MRGVTTALSARRRPLHRRLVESEEPTASPQRLPETRTSVCQGCTDSCYCKISLRFSSNSALSISPLANRSFKISKAREAVSYTSGSSSRRALRRPQKHMMKSSIRSGKWWLPCRFPQEVQCIGPCASPVARPKCGPVPDFGPKPAHPIELGGRAALPDRIVEAAVRRLRCTGSISACVE